MGSKFAPIYATLVLPYLEAKCTSNLKRISTQISENTLKRISNDF